MDTHSCEYPVAHAPDDLDVADHGPLPETAVSWNAFTLVIVTAFSSYVF